MAKKYWKSQVKVREFCQSGKVGSLCQRLFSIEKHGVNVHSFCCRERGISARSFISVIFTVHFIKD